MKKSQSNNQSHLVFLLFDVVTLVISFIFSYYFKFRNFGLFENENWMMLFFIVILVHIIVCLLSNPYSLIYQRPYYEEIVHALMITLYDILVISIVFYIFKVGTLFSRQMILTMFLAYLIVSIFAKCIIKKTLLFSSRKKGQTRLIPILIICEEKNATATIQNIMSSDLIVYDIKGFYLTDSNVDKHGQYPVVSNIINGVDELQVREVIVNTPNAYDYYSICNQLQMKGIEIHYALENVLGFQSENYSIDYLGSYQSLSVGLHNFSIAQKAYFPVKRVLDFIFSLFCFVLLIPISLIVKIAYLISGDKGEIIFKQTRVGKDGKLIKIYKFRTMVQNADDILKEMLLDDSFREEWHMNRKIENDPRITKIGRFLRKTSLDEFPQVINILLGNMSFVGPRPLVYGELEDHNGLKMYQQVKPGITGWWGCNGRSNISYKERLELEYYYIRNFSPYLDFLCVLRTIWVVLKREGAQ